MKMRRELKDTVAGANTSDVKGIYDIVAAKYPPHVQVAVAWKNVKSRMYAIQRNAVSQGEPGVRCHVCLAAVEEQWSFMAQS